jgi:hypothetical protein
LAVCQQRQVGARAGEQQPVARSHYLNNFAGLAEVVGVAKLSKLKRAATSPASIMLLILYL